MVNTPCIICGSKGDRMKGAPWDRFCGPCLHETVRPAYTAVRDVLGREEADSWLATQYGGPWKVGDKTRGVGN